MPEDNSSKNGSNGAFQNVADPKIDAIKQIIFGDNMAEYDQRFDTIRAQIEQAKSEIEDKLEAQNENLLSELNSLKKDIEKSIDTLTNKTNKEMARLDDAKANRKALGKMLQNIGDKLSQ